MEKIMVEAINQFQEQDEGDNLIWRLQGLGNFDDKVKK
jgi:hypothetical protein